MIIKVTGYLTYREVIGKREVSLPDNVPVLLIDFIQELATNLGGEHGHALYDAEAGTIGPWVAVMLNGRHYNHLPDRLDTVLRNQDEVAVFPPGAGG